MLRLSNRYRLIAPDLRGFGDSEKPNGPFGPADHAVDMLALLNALDIKRAGIVGHDVGGAAMQPLARKAPERVVGLFFFDFVYPGIGARMGAPDRLNEIWYQGFNQMDMAPVLAALRGLLAKLIFRISYVTGHIGRTHLLMYCRSSRTIFLSPEILPAALRITKQVMQVGLQ